MRFLTRTVIVLVIFNSAIAGPALAQFGDGPVTKRIYGYTGVGGVVMKGLPDDPVSDETGYYRVNVLYGWAGTVTPMKEGCTFEPASRTYPKVTSDKINQDYNAKVTKFTISGSTQLLGVTMTGLPGNPVTGGDGNYIVHVDYGWTGTIAPAKDGYVFTPANRRYRRTVRDLINENYAAERAMVTISGQLLRGGVPIDGAAFSADNGGGSGTSDAQGMYSLKVPYGWSGKVMPSKQGIDFNPPSISFTDVTTDTVVGKTDRPNYEEVDPFGGFGGSGSRGRSLGSDLYSGSPWDSSGSRSRGRSSSGYNPAIRSGGRKALVIPAGEIKAKELAETVEDMHVMSHILDEQFKETRRIQGMFTDFGAFFGRDSRSTEATYLQGFGVLFVMEVNFAFSPPPKTQAQDPTETTEAGDSTWQKARRQVLSPGVSPGMGQEGSADDYDNQMVEELKKELVNALKHASNIRNIEPDEWVILTVIGGQRQFGMGFGSGLPMGGNMSGTSFSARGGASSGSMGGYGGSAGSFSGGSYGGMISGGSFGGGMTGGFGGFGTTASSPSTVLTIRAKKSDVDDFAEGALGFEQFQEKVKILTY